MLRMLPVVWIAGNLAACGYSGTPEGVTPNTTHSQEVVVRALTVSVSERGIAGINAETTFSEEAITKAFPGGRIESGMHMTEDQPYPVYQILDGERILLRVEPNPAHDKVRSVWILDSRIRLSSGVGIGSVYTEIYGASGDSNCWPGNEEYAGGVFCRAPASEHLVLLFQGKWNGPDSELPPDEVLKAWSVNRVVWTTASTQKN